MGLSCGGKLGMVFLVVLNILFFLLGLGILIVGIIMKVETDVFDKSEVIHTLNQVSFNGSLSLGDVAKGLSTFAICLGVFIVLISGMGLFGACCKVKCLLIMYAVLVIIIVIVQCVCIGLWVAMKDQVDTTVKSKMNDVLNQYQGYSTTHEVSVGWNLLFIGFDCCGVEAVHATSNNNEFAGSYWVNNGAAGSKKIPPSCCSAATETNYATYTEAACTDTITSGYRTKGCYEKFNDFIDKYQYWAIGVSATLIVIEIIAVIAAFLICYQVGKKNEVV